MTTTPINEPIEKKEKQKAGQLLEAIRLRDYFAAQALQGILNQSDTFWTGAAPLAYQYADAMLKVRSE